MQDTVETYNVKKNRWTLLPANIPPRQMHVTITMENNIYILGGLPRAYQETPTKACDIFDLKTMNLKPITGLIR